MLTGEVGNVINEFTVLEGGSASYGVRLASRPTANVVVSIAEATGAGQDTDVTVTSPANRTLTFTPANWDTVQAVTISAAADPDDNANGTDPTNDSTAGAPESAAAAADNNANGTRTITHTATGAPEFAGVSRTLVVTRRDAGAGITLAPESLRVPENGSATYTVALDAMPASGVTVQLAAGDDSDADITFSPASLTFTPQNYAAPQTVTVSAAADDDSTHGSATIVHTAYGGGYRGVTATLTATETDATGGQITLSASSLTVTEGGTATYTVRLSQPPTANVTVTLTGAGYGDVTFRPASLTFTPQNYAAPQTVTVDTVADDDLLDDATTITHTAAGGGYDGATADVTVTETDAGVQIELSASAVSVTEGGSATYTVRLSHQPTGNVTVAIAEQSGGDADVRVTSSKTLTFTTSNWNVAQTVSLYAGYDNDTAAGSRTITHTAAAGGYDGVTAVITVQEVDTYSPSAPSSYVPYVPPNPIVLSPTSLTVNEGSTATYTVKLRREPTANVTVAIAQETGGDASITVSSASLTFTANDWNTAQTVTVTAAADDTDVVNGEATFKHTATSTDDYFDTEHVSLNVTERDDDTGSITLSVNTLSVPEGRSATYQVKLSHQPAADVTVQLSRSGDGDITFDTDNGRADNQSTLTFTPDNYDTGQAVFVAAAQDNDDDVNGTATIKHTANGGGYSNVTATLTATEADDEGAIVIWSASSDQSISGLTVTEGSTNQYRVKLNYQPTANVTVTLAVTGDSDITITNPASPHTLTFTGSDYGAKSVTVSAAADAGDYVDGTATITHTASSQDANYNNVSANLKVTEDDEAYIKILNPGDGTALSNLSVPEGGSATYHVKLSHRTTAGVTVNLTSIGGDRNLTFLPSSLTFTSNNWNDTQTVTVSASEDRRRHQRNQENHSYRRWHGRWHGLRWHRNADRHRGGKRRRRRAVPRQPVRHRGRHRHLHRRAEVPAQRGGISENHRRRRRRHRHHGQGHRRQRYGRPDHPNRFHHVQLEHRPDGNPGRGPGRRPDGWRKSHRARRRARQLRHQREGPDCHRGRQHDHHLPRRQRNQQRRRAVHDHQLSQQLVLPAHDPQRRNLPGPRHRQPQQHDHGQSLQPDRQHGLHLQGLQRQRVYRRDGHGVVHHAGGAHGQQLEPER